MKLFELDLNNPIDRELKKTSDDATTDGSLDQDDIDAQNDPTMASDGAGDPFADDPLEGPDNAPEEPMAGVADMPEPEVEKNPVDSGLMSLMQGHDYMTRYDHSDHNAKSHPATIMGMEMTDLSNLRNRLRVFMDHTGVSDRIGKYDDPRVKAAQDQLAFVDKVMGFKKYQAKDTKTATGKKPKVRTQEQSKVKAGQKFKAKRS